MKRKLLYILNPISGTTNKKTVEELIRKKSSEKNVPFEIFPSVASGDYSFLVPIIEEKQITDVVIAGGDGTVSQVVNSLSNCKVNFGIIPCGSGNGLAYSAGIPKSKAAAADIIFSGKPVSVDAFFINNHFGCMLCGVGFDAKVAEDFAKQPARGLATYIKQVVKNFFTAKTYSFELTVNDTTITTDAFFISIANSNQFGNNFTIAPKASLTDGLLDIVIVTNQSRLALLVEVIKQVSGRNKLQKSIVKMKKGILYFQTDKLKIKNLSGAPLHIDGDPAETPEVLDISVSKKFFKLIQPV